MDIKMKKSVVILIGIIYVASIALVSFFGLKFKVFDQIIPVERIEILNEGLKENDMWGKYAIVNPDENGDRRYQIKWRVYPDDASDNSVDFSYDLQNTVATIDEMGVVTFSKPGMIKITLIPKDGSDTSAVITIIAK